jgi:hypothetical protein
LIEEIWKVEEPWRAMVRAKERKNLTGRGYPLSDMAEETYLMAGNIVASFGWCMMVNAMH